MRGPKPKPVEVRLREGNLSRRPLPEPVVLGGRPDLEELADPPEHLDADAREFWSHTVLRLVETGLVDRLDLAMLELAAVQYARARQAGRAIAERGLERALVRTERDATLALLRIAEQYGMTASARTRLGVAELHRRSLAREMADALGEPELVEVVD